MTDIDRRTFVASTAGTAASIALAGCSDGGGAAEEDEDMTEESMDDEMTDESMTEEESMDDSETMDDESMTEEESMDDSMNETETMDG